MDSNALDRHITGNYGEDEMRPEYVKAREIAFYPAGTRIDVSKDTDPEEIVATIEKVAVTSGFIHVTAAEYACVLVFSEDDMIRLADD